jgi:hypothetical protein
MFNIGESEIDRLKRKARTAFYAMESIGDRMDCGHALAREISADYNAAAIRYDDAVARLREIDPAFPKVTAA